MWTDTLVIVAAVIAGGVSAVTGFGIGSLLTPLLATEVDTKVAVAAVSIPHVLGTALRFSLVQGTVDRRVLWGFGLASAVAGLIGALLQGWAANRWLNGLFGGLLLFAAASEASGLARRLRFRGTAAWVAGAVSGLLGGLVGNQGGVRSAALLGFDLSRHTFVATATAIALFVDGARLPVYLVTQYQDLIALARWIAVASIGVIAGTVLGSRVLRRIPEVWFRRVLALILAMLGGVMLARAVSG
jgi:uncharacterized membrane protein YfcA